MKMKTPIEATDNDLAKMKRCDYSYKGFWCLTDGYRLSFHRQNLGEPSTQDITIPIVVARKLIAFLNTPQEVK